MIHPNIFSDIDRRYVGFNGLANQATAIHTLPDGQSVQYQYYSGWDVYRSQIPLVGFLFKDIARDIIRSLVNNANQAGNTLNTGGFTRWGVANNDSGVMGGDPSSVMISTINALGATLSPAEADAVIAVFKRSGKSTDLSNDINKFQDLGVTTSNTKSGSGDIKSLNVKNNPYSKRLEFAAADYARSAFIFRQRDRDEYTTNATKKLALQTDGAAFKTASREWRKVFTGTGDSRRINPNNSCRGHKCYHEGTASQYRWMMTYDMAGYFAEIQDENVVDPISKIVTNPTIKNALNVHFGGNLISRESGSLYNAGNQVGFATPYTYHYIGLPNASLLTVRKKLAQYWENALITYPGNEDGGSQSAQFAWASMGLYPHAVGTDRLLLLYPAFDYVHLNIPDPVSSLASKTLILKRDASSTAEASVADACVESVTADGVVVDGSVESGYNYTKSYIRYRDITRKTVLSFKIVPRQSDSCDHVSWGKKEEDIPLSNTEY